PFIIYTLTNVRISRMSNHGDAEGSATETVDLVYSHIRWDIPAYLRQGQKHTINLMCI
ncbi:type VI secretion system tube protein Hcp, partial [Salmonella enterica subsp. enterica serovar Mbandaka]|nr:type VI secretion system tube protein Hcp [Salmonella enterica subsp. enterica serovar Mbandaka]